MNVYGHFACHRGTKHLKIKSTDSKGDRDFIAAVNLRMWGVWGSPERVGGFEEKSPDDGPMRANPYGIIVLEKHRMGLKVIECS